jgi:hypothetical protein
MNIHQLLALVYLQHGGDPKQFKGEEVEENMRFLLNSQKIIDVEIINNEIVPKEK